MTRISKNILAALLVVTVVISVFGTWVTLMVTTGQFKLPVPPEPPTAHGKVSVNVLSDVVLPPAEPSETEGRVAVFVK
ncbi:MAG: hypothetical protein JXC85_02635 [Candidatus Aenigmarchaeota archaeon]|nr:hypothetical protein [Candidatus Aenigmarchaeota archaeon]